MVESLQRRCDSAIGPSVDRTIAVAGAEDTVNNIRLTPHSSTSYSNLRELQRSPLAAVAKDNVYSRKRPADTVDECECKRRMNNEP